MARLKIVDQFDSHFTLDPEARAALYGLLTSDAFVAHLCQQASCAQVEFTDLLFQPVPYTLQATKGMPVEFEHYHNSPNYLIINVPPNVMFKAKIFQPSRLCAIYRIVIPNVPAHSSTATHSPT